MLPRQSNKKNQLKMNIKCGINYKLSPVKRENTILRNVEKWK